MALTWLALSAAAKPSPSDKPEKPSGLPPPPPLHFSRLDPSRPRMPTTNAPQTSCALVRSRTTTPLTSTVSKFQASLDFTSSLALTYAERWLIHAGGLQVPASGVIRRALALYAQHLNKDTTEALEEFKSVQRACRVSSTPQEDQEAALQRLNSVQAPEPLPAFLDVLRGPQWASDMAVSQDRYEQLIKSTGHAPS